MTGRSRGSCAAVERNGVFSAVFLEKKKALFRQQESHRALLDAQDSIKKLNSEKNRLKAELDEFKENRDRLQKEVRETQAAADEAKKLLDKNPSNVATNITPLSRK